MEPTSSRSKGESKSKNRRRHSSRSRETKETSVNASSLKDNRKDRRDDGAPTTDRDKEKKAVKDIKKEVQPCPDMFEGSDLLKPVKKEKQETDIHPPEVKRESGADESKDRPIKTEHHQIPLKSESLSSEVCHFPSAPSSPSPDVTVGTQTTPAAIVKREVPQPSDDEDDDFNVDVMLDSLDYERKSEPSDAPVKLEKEGEETAAAVEAGETTATAAVAAATLAVKSKNQVKRVTWNIQEPEGPQPEKSSSSECCHYATTRTHAHVTQYIHPSCLSLAELALYKLKLKQEGLRRPASLCQTSSQVRE